jgi:pyrimidine operon attenuation protein/uracil phosphoribosyltransferase
MTRTLLASDFTTDAAMPSVADLGRMTTTELVALIDAGWQQLRGRLTAAPPGAAPIG